MYLLTFAPNEDSHQPAHPCNLIRVIIVHVKKPCNHGYPKCVQWRFWSDCAFAQADLNLRWAHRPEGTVSNLTFQMLIVIFIYHQYVHRLHVAHSIQTYRQVSALIDQILYPAFQQLSTKWPSLNWWWIRVYIKYENPIHQLLDSIDHSICFFALPLHCFSHILQITGHVVSDGQGKVITY